MITSHDFTVREVLRYIPVFANIEPESEEWLNRHARLVFDWPVGDNVISQIETSVVCVLSGLVEVESPKRRAIAHCAAGDVLGDEAALRRATFPFNARARTHCDLLVIPGEAFRTLWLKSPCLQHSLAVLYQERTEAWEDYYDSFQKANKEARVALVLRNIAQAAGREKILTWDEACLPFTVEWWESKTAIGEMLSISTPKVREALTTMTRADAIDMGELENIKRIRLLLTLQEGCIPILTNLIDAIL